jgi:CBS domain-containing protein
MAKISQLLEMKGHEVFSVVPEASVYDAIETMANKSVGALLVLEHGRIVGILSERDYARKVILQGRSSRTTTVGEIMSSPVRTVPSTCSVEEAMAIMTEHRVRHLPVVDDGWLRGLISVGDLVKAIIDEQRFEIAQLHNYIHS